MTEVDHLRKLLKTFERLQSLGLTLHRDKCEFLRPSIEFFGFVFKEGGVSPDPRKVQDIKKAQPPESASDIRSFLGMVTYCGRFIQNLASKSEPLRALTKKESVWHWGPLEQAAFEDIKSALAAEDTMAFFDPVHLV
ncbi:uncharacterized protein [Ambystoma mexicanum]|uniref:uncharacterized protein n=1 Tax=Ambystoma mexicanum TaxID=8296 RepID=UPI0037E9A515